MPLRQHVVSVVAIFLALAVGVVLGGGPLSDVGSAALTGQPSPSGDQPGDRSGDPVAAAGDGYADELATATAARAYDGGLAERSVALVVLPGAAAGAVEQLVGQVIWAGGTVSATYTVSDVLLDPGEKSLVDTLGSQLEQQVETSRVADDATTYDRIGQLLGGAVATTRPEGSRTDQDTATIVESLGGAGLLTASAAAERRAPLLLVVLGTDPGVDADPILEGLVGGLTGTAVGVVVAGDASAAGEGGVLARLRTQPLAASLTTTDGVDAAAGQATAVFALIRSLSVVGGAFGAAGADGAVPLG